MITFFYWTLEVGTALASEQRQPDNPGYALLPIILIFFVCYFLYKRFKAPPKARQEIRRTRNWIGQLLIASGVIALVFGFGMDTTVPTIGGTRVHNIGLMNDRQNLIILSGLSILIGVIVSLRQRRSTSADNSEMSADEDRVNCPYCAELIKREARICRCCNRDIDPAR